MKHTYLFVILLLYITAEVVSKPLEIDEAEADSEVEFGSEYHPGQCPSDVMTDNSVHYHLQRIGTDLERIDEHLI